jgi:hypothetical protein
MSQLFLLDYSSPSLQVQLTGNYVVKRHAKCTYSNPVSATPSHVSWEEETMHITDTQLEELMNMIKSNGFYALESSYGANQQERHYPYSLVVNVPGLGEKKIVYRSRPDAPACPTPFRDIERFLHQLKAK